MNNQPIAYINFAGILIISAILSGAYYFQFAMNEYPCPLCLLQRLCFFGIMIGLFLNLKFGFSSTHYGLSILSALLGAGISYRQILLHICPSPTDHGYGTPVFGMHLYSWALVAYLVSILCIAFLLLSPKQFEKGDKQHVPSFSLLAGIAFGICFLLALTNGIATFFECGFGICPDDPDSYMIFNGKWW
ncbi:disulfide bond formation protein B [Chryseobacterium sp. PMSZPI]|uniref:disulfide bond formation protein B n=1 Tax=Chryseobacterium sp. PMSZPI TaxID=1033900 RepID=UPI000C33D073|nr:disulfide bond formation protein B [Chryseobacterium sp. PMSZPI]PKF75981.1 disulfide bond formation protein B [Chryseobacterium sp. PMSZPI]